MYKYMWNFVCRFCQKITTRWTRALAITSSLVQYIRSWLLFEGRFHEGNHFGAKILWNNKNTSKRDRFGIGSISFDWITAGINQRSSSPSHDWNKRKITAACAERKKPTLLHKHTFFILSKSAHRSINHKSSKRKKRVHEKVANL